MTTLTHNASDSLSLGVWRSVPVVWNDCGAERAAWAEEMAMKICVSASYWVVLTGGAVCMAGGCAGVGADIRWAHRVGITQEELVRRTQELDQTTIGRIKRKTSRGVVRELKLKLE